MPRVYIPNRSTHDYTNAKAFGELVFLTDGFIDPRKLSNLVRVCAEGMADSTSEDFLMVAGLPVIVGICSAIFARKHGRLNYLVFNGRGNYEARELILRSESDE